MSAAKQDIRLRHAAFEHVNRLVAFQNGILSSDDLAAGFAFDGERIPLVNPQRGIFKPRQMSGAALDPNCVPETGRTRLV